MKEVTEKRPRNEGGPGVCWQYNARMARPASSSMHVATPCVRCARAAEGGGNPGTPLNPYRHAASIV